MNQKKIQNFSENKQREEREGDEIWKSLRESK